MLTIFYFKVWTACYHAFIKEHSLLVPLPTCSAFSTVACSFPLFFLCCEPFQRILTASLKFPFILENTKQRITTFISYLQISPTYLGIQYINDGLFFQQARFICCIYFCNGQIQIHALYIVWKKLRIWYCDK